MASDWAMQGAAQAWCTKSTSAITMDVILAEAFAEILDAECAKARNEAEQLRVQLAGCSVAAMGGTTNPAKRGDYGWSPAYQNVLDLRIKLDELSVSSDRKVPYWLATNNVDSTYL